jgi:hypothetical protein
VQGCIEVRIETRVELSRTQVFDDFMRQLAGDSSAAADGAAGSSGSINGGCSTAAARDRAVR